MASQKEGIELLTFGYINRNKNDIYIPVEIAELIILYYNEYVYWTMTEEQIKQLHNAKNGDVLYSSSSFIIKEIEFTLAICANGWRISDAGHCDLYLETKHMPANIDHIRIFFHISCETTNVQAKFMRTWQQTGNGQAIGICSFYELKHLTQIDLNCMVQMLSLKYKPNANKIDYILPINMNDIILYNWELDRYQMQLIKQRKDRWLYSDNFGNNNWCMCINPKGYRHESAFPGLMVVEIECLRIPNDVIEMKTKYHITISSLSNEILYISSGNSASLLFGKCMRTWRIEKDNRMCLEGIDIDNLCHCESIKISIHVQIV